MTSWDDCLGHSSAWLTTTLQQRLHYAAPLPVQHAVVPVVTRAVLSGVPLDVSLTAPTGSGKTLCYLLPMLRLITEGKKGVDDIQLRGLVLVPTRALGQQVHRELQRLLRHTTIIALSLCADVGSVKEEAHDLVRGVQLGGKSDPHTTTETLYFSRADLLITTPQRLLRHLDSTPGLRLASLQFLVIDEADQVLAGNFANFVAKVVDRFRDEVETQQRDDAGALTGRRVGDRVLHKMLCSATLTSRIARVSEVRLRNCRYFTLDSHGTEVGAGAASTALVRTTFALPPSLQEHIVFVEDRYRHAVLLKLVRGLLDSIAARTTDTPSECATATEYPATKDNAGSRVLVFCSSADEARVMGHFLLAAGVRQVIEFTTAATEAERRRALLLRGQRGGCCVVASDALMRGIDLPDVGHVIMYHPPSSLAQYVHRAGRTARAMRPGHVHLLLSKLGPDATQEHGEVARYKELSAALTRTRAAVYERQFFRFARAPGAAHADAPESTTPPAPGTAQDAEWWVAEADRCLQKLRRHQREMAVSAATVATTGRVGTNDAEAAESTPRKKIRVE